jgi:hypothetical protein
MLYNKAWDKATTPSQLLLRAADLIEERGKSNYAFLVTPGSRWDVDEGQKVGSMCAMGAIMVAAGYEDKQVGWATISLDPLVNKTIMLLREEVGSVGPWNNSTTKEDVMTKLREVAEMVGAAEFESAT